MSGCPTGMRVSLESAVSEYIYTMPPRRYRITSDEARRRIILAYDNQEDFVTVASNLGIRRTTAYEIVRNYVNNGRIHRIHAGGRQRVLDNETIDFVVTLIESNPAITLHEMIHTVRQTWPKNLSFLGPHYRGLLTASLLHSNYVRTFRLSAIGQMLKHADASMPNGCYSTFTIIVFT